jgi:hypothetical protein
MFKNFEVIRSAHCKKCRADLYWQAYSDLKEIQKRDAYEHAKAALPLDLSAKEYEQAIKAIAKRLKY